MKVENLKSKSLKKAYAGSIQFKNNNKIGYWFWTNLILHPFYEYVWRKFISYNTMLRDRSKLKCKGIVHWDIGMREQVPKLYREESFVLYTIKTRGGVSPLVIKTLLSKVEDIAKKKGKNEMYGYSIDIRPHIAKRFGWESRWLGDIYRFRKEI